MPTTSKRKTLADALGKVTADASISDVIGSEIAIRKYTKEERKIDDKQTTIAFIYLDEPVACIHDKKNVEAKILSTFSEFVIRDLDKLAPMLDTGEVITATVRSGKSANGTYQYLE